MAFAQGKPKDKSAFVTNLRHVILPLLLAGFALVTSAQTITPSPSTPGCPAPQAQTAIYPTSPLDYPKTSDEYSVEYKIDNAAWARARVYISKYGGSNSSPYLSYSGYNRLETSMSFVSIPAGSNANVQLRVTKKPDASFETADNVSIRPSVLADSITTKLQTDGKVLISTTTGGSFLGEQFILWWHRGASVPMQGGDIQGLAFFLNPLSIYTAPTPSSKVIVQVIGGASKVIVTPEDLNSLSADPVNTLDIEGTVAIEGSYGSPPAVPVVVDGAGVFDVPVNITTIFLGPDAWLQGKLRFAKGASVTIYGPGVLDVSRFQYNLRACGSATDYAGQGYFALSSSSPNRHIENLKLNGIIISDTNHAAVDLLYNGNVNNVKTLGWNAENGGFLLKDGTTGSNMFIRSGDDSLMVWGSDITITNATVWQNYNGGVVNLGWSTNSPGDNDQIDGLNVVKTDWLTPPLPPSPRAPSWTTTTLDNQNNGVIVSLMRPGTMFGAPPATPPAKVSLFQNIFVEDSPRVFLSLKIVPTNCSKNSTRTCPSVDLSSPSVLNLDIENVFTPASTLQNSIGFQILPAGYSLPAGCVQGTEGCNYFPTVYQLTGTMHISLLNFFVVSGSTATALTSANAESLGNIATNGDVTVKYNPLIKPPPPPLCKLYTCN